LIAKTENSNKPRESQFNTNLSLSLIDNPLVDNIPQDNSQRIHQKEITLSRSTLPSTKLSSLETNQTEYPVKLGNSKEKTTTNITTQVQKQTPLPPKNITSTVLNKLKSNPTKTNTSEKATTRIQDLIVEQKNLQNYSKSSEPLPLLSGDLWPPRELH